MQYENYENRLKELDDKFRRVYSDLLPGAGLVPDGIANIENFRAITPKILWILKESVDKDMTSWSMRDFMNEGLITTHNIKPTWNLIIKISYSLFNKISDFENIPDWNYIDIQNISSKIALINIKKVGGYSKSDTAIIKKYYNNTKTLIKEQIDLIEPDIIFNCSRVHELFFDIINEKEKYFAPFCCSKYNDKIIINAYHPASMFSKAKYFRLCKQCLNYYGCKFI